MCDEIICGDQPHMPAIKVPEHDRRAFLKGLISLPLASVLAVPALAKAAADRTDYTELTSDKGTATGYMAAAQEPEAPAVLLIHEWWGLNDQIKAVAHDFAAQGYNAFAIDLYGGEVADSREDAIRLVRAVERSEARDKLRAAVDVLKTRHGKVGSVGWCFGGSWSLAAAMAGPVDAAVIYYGRINHPKRGFSRIKGPVMGHFGTQDTGIPPEMVAKLSEGMESAGKADDLTIHWYDAGHAFANPTGSRYDAPDAALAWDRTTAFFAEHLRG